MIRWALHSPLVFVVLLLAVVSWGPAPSWSAANNATTTVAGWVMTLGQELAKIVVGDGQ